MSSPTLQQLGEREIVRAIIPKYATGTGSDCATIPMSFSEMSITTDPVPIPAAKVIAGDGDFYWMGWLSVVINASDIAAAGCAPIAFLAAIDAPGTMSVLDFERLLGGIRDASKAEGLAFVGGNLREADRVMVVGTAIGGTATGKSLTRVGATPGDAVLAIGAGGCFWRDALMVKNGGAVADKSKSPLFAPRSQITVMQRLALSGRIVAAMDNSDGLLASLQQIAELNRLSVELDLECLTVEGEPVFWKGKEVERARLWLGWGDWNVIAVVKQDNVESVLQMVVDGGGTARMIGRCEAGEATVHVRRASQIQKAPRLESERFCLDSWFTAGIDSYIAQLCEMPLP